MDMQGNPIGGGNTGTKVNSNSTIREGAGDVASDSLAAESYRQGGDFAQNRNAAPLGVSGSSGTFSNSDTTNAIRLDASRDHSSRDADSSERYPESLGGQGQFSGSHNLKDGYVGGPTGSGGNGTRDSGYGATSSSGGSGNFSSSDVDAAPNYTLNQQGAFQDSKPKGRNITEGGFSGEGSNYASGIGTRDDPGRAALQDFQKSSARADPGARADMGGIDNQQPYDSLDRDERA